MKIPFHRASVSEEEITAVSGVLRSGWLTMGEKTFEFEKNFSDYTGAVNSIAVNSCTAALHLALKAAGIGPGDEVIIPAMTFISTWEVLTYIGAIPVVADVEKDTHLINVRDLESKITSSTKAVIPVHYAGQPCDMDEIIALSKIHGFAVIEDAAHSLPASYKGRNIGTIGDLTCFSFYATKTVTTGEGGMVTTENEEYAERIRRLRLHGITKDAWNRYSDKGSWYYDVSEAGYKYNPSDMTSAMGIEQLKKSDRMNLERTKIADFYNQCFADSDMVEGYTVRDDRRSAWHLYPLKLNLHALAADRNKFIEELKTAGIGTSVHFIPLYRFTCFQKYNLNPENFPGAEYVFEREISLPIYPGMSEAEIQYVADNVLAAAWRYRR